jgi:hypothetical protein
MLRRDWSSDVCSSDLDFMAQVQSYLMTHQYENLLKKANFKGGLAR